MLLLLLQLLLPSLLLEALSSSQSARWFQHRMPDGMPVAAAAGPSSALLFLEPELQVQVLRGLGPAGLRSARLACSALRSLADTQVVTGLQLDVVRSQRCLEAGSIYLPEDEQEGGHGEMIRPSLAELQDEEADIEEELDLDLPQLALQLLAIHNTLLHEQQGTAELQQLAQQHGRLVEMLGRHKKLHEVRRQQVEVRLEQAAVVQEQIERQINCMATADEAVVQLTAAKARFPALHRLTLRAAEVEDCVLDGAALSTALAAAPLGLLEQLALPRCRLNDAVIRQLDGKACRLDLGLHVENELQQQLTLLCKGGGWQANLHSLSLVESWGPVSPLSQWLSPLSALTSLRELTLKSRSIDSDAAQVLGGLTHLVTLRARDWVEGAGPTLPTSLCHLELLDIALGLGGGGEAAMQAPDELNEDFLVPRCIQRALPPGAKLSVHLNLCYGQCLQEWGSLQALLAMLGAQLRSWAGLRAGQGRRRWGAAWS